MKDTCYEIDLASFTLFIKGICKVEKRREEKTYDYNSCQILSKNFLRRAKIVTLGSHASYFKSYSLFYFICSGARLPLIQPTVQEYV